METPGPQNSERTQIEEQENRAAEIEHSDSSAAPAQEFDAGVVGADEIHPDNPEGTSDNLDAVIPPHTPDAMPIVGLGGSAGAIGALREFFGLMPHDSGFAFVVVIHLAPDHASTLPEILQATTKMPVLAVNEPTPLESNRVYVIPPNVHLSLTDGKIVPQPPVHENGKRVAVDLFFRALADNHGSNATCVVLSGADSDGVIGLKRIKERGGLTVAQSPEEAEHDSMPRAAIATGMVDWILPIGEMPARLIAHLNNEKVLRLPPEATESFTADEQEQAKKQVAEQERQRDENALREVLAFLRARTGHDFTHYKRATVLRRIGRRLQVNSLPDIPSYLEYLRSNPGEAGALLHDLLISVTNFFRDPESFAALQSIIPKLFYKKTRGDQVRVWVAGCATGEEAYSVAMLLHEYAARLDAPPSILVFATDLSDAAIAAAREGSYPPTIEADVSPERLRRFFTFDGGTYRVRREVREMILFATHNLLKDSPFSRLDLVTCRNLLIYLGREAQQRVFETFHFSLKPDGVLFLGTSESADDVGSLFALHDKKHRLYVRRNAGRHVVPPLPPPGARLAIPPVAAAGDASTPAAATVPDNAAPVGADTNLPRRRSVTFGELHLALLERLSPPSVVINEDYEIIHLSESAGRFLQFAGGQPSTNLLRMVNPMLRLELGAALFTASQRGQDLRVANVAFEEGAETQYVDLHIRPILDAAEAGRGLIVVLFEETGRTESTPLAPRSEPVTRQLEEELQQLKANLRATVEQYEVSVEELKASNEELQAMNEEARSTAEELETSKEELQSVNEELTTVNQELRANVEELSRANNDLQNLMAATDIATIFLDPDLRIKRYTPRAAQIFNIIPTDVERPLVHITHKLEYPELPGDAELVLKKLTPMYKEVRSAEGEWFRVQLLPYRTGDNRIEGLVLTLVEITALKNAEEAVAADLHGMRLLHEVSSRLMSEDNVGVMYEEIVKTAMALTGADAGTVQLYDKSTQQLILLASQGLDADLREQFARVPAGTATSCGLALARNERCFLEFDQPGVPDPDGSARAHLEAGFRAAQSTPLVSRAGQPIGMVSTHWREHHCPTEREFRFLDLLARQATDLLERRKVEVELRASEEKYRTLFNSIDEGFALIEVLYDEAGEPIDAIHLEANPTFARLTGLRNPAGKTGGVVRGVSEPFWIETFDHVVRTGQTTHVEHQRALTGQWFRVFAARVGGADSHQVAVVFDDITERKRIEAHQTLLSEVTTELVKFNEVAPMMEMLSEKIGRHFDAKYCIFSEHVENVETPVSSYGWHAPDMPSLEGDLLHGLLADEEMKLLLSGEPLVVHNTQTDPRVGASRYGSRRIHSFIIVPLIQNGQWRFQMAIMDSKPREWRDDEIALMCEIPSRLWSTMERTRAQQELHESEERFRIAVDAAGMGTWNWDLKIGRALWNEQHYRLFGLEPDGQLKEYSFFEKYVHEDDRALVRENLDRALREDVPFTAEFRAVRPDGEIRWMSGYGRVIERENGKATRMGGVLYDSTERQQAEAALRESEERFRLLVEGTSDYAMFLMDADRKIIHWNIGAERVFGWTREEAIGQSADIIFTPEDRKKGEPGREAEQAVREGRALDRRWHLRKNGSRFWADGVMSCLGDRSTLRGFVKIARDTTRQKETEEELRRAHDEMEQRVVDRTLELGQANSVLRKQTQELQRAEAERQLLLQRLVMAQEEERKRISRELHDQMGQTLTALKVGLSTQGAANIDGSDNLLNLQRLLDDLVKQVHNLAWELRPALLDNFGLESALEQYVNEWTKQSGITADFASRGFTRARRMSAHAETALFRVVQEALTNVQRHSKATQVSVILERAGDEVRAVVEDNGKGFKMNVNARSKRRGRDSKTESSAAVTQPQRLGLVGMRERMELIGGTLTIESKIGGGTTVYARAPFESQSTSDNA